MVQQWRITRFGIVAAVRTGALIGFGLGIVLGILWGAVAVVLSSVIVAMFDVPLPAAGALAVIVVPIFSALIYTTLGAMLGFLVSLLYNLSVGLAGGLTIEVEDDRPERPASFI